ncbi:hypothetical protein SCG7086_AA_00770 [Chlamydiales bacterium SCGC AG-110-P3]|nr:hypothetical protein SCG7086_AA_00770 [Chlamydiales bacterium SCGC AG-110-P3]
MILACLAVYLLLQLLLVFLVARNTNTEEEYYLAGSRLGTGFATLSIFATWFGVETCIGSSAAIFHGGLFSSRAEPFGYTICLLLMGFLFARRLWARHMTTLGDLFREKYNSVLVEKLAVIIIIPSVLIWTAAQIKAFGYILNTVTPLSLNAGISVAVAVVIAYAVFGGLIGDVITDVIQGVILILGLAFLLWYAVDYFHQNALTFSDIDAKRLSFISAGESIWTRIDAWCIPIIGSLVSQEMIFRIVASRTPTIAKSSCILAAGLYLVVGLIPVALGLMGPHILPTLDGNDSVLMQIAETLLPLPIFIIFTGALVSAILSTVDSTLLSISAFMTHNLMGRFFYQRNEAGRLWLAKLSVVVVGLVAYAIALRDEGIYDLVIWASSLGTSGLAVVTVMALYAPNYGNRLAACSTLIVGLIAEPILERIPGVQAPYLLTCIACIMCYLLLGLRPTKRRAS